MEVTKIELQLTIFIYPNFLGVYDVLQEGFIHVHHIVDLAKIFTEYKVNPEANLMPVYPNCHAMFHKIKLEM